MLRTTTQEGSEPIIPQLESKLAGPRARELACGWQVTKDMEADKKLNLEEITRPEEVMPRQPASTKRSWLDRLRKIMPMAVTVVILSMLAGGWTVAAEPSPQRLTLEEAVKLALRQNPQVTIANLNVAQSQQDQLEARAALLPQAGFQVSDLARRANLEASLGQRIPILPQHSGPFQVFQAGPQLSMPIFDLSLWRRWQASRHGVKASQSQETSAREQIVLVVVSQYLGGLRAAAAVKAARSRVELAQALYDQAAELQKNGVGTGLDTLRANVQLQNEKQLLIMAETQQKTSLYGLARLLALNPQQPIELADEVSFFATPEIPAAQSLEEAYATRPELKTLMARELATQASKKAASASRLPTVTFNGTWAYQGLSLGRSIPTYQYEAGVNFPLFTGGRIKAEITRADLELKKVAQQIKDTQAQVALEVQTAVAQLDSARSEVEVANLGVSLAKQEVEQAGDRFQAGVASNIEVTSAQDALARANDNQIGALYRYNQARADLAHATGQIEKLYAK